MSSPFDLEKATAAWLSPFDLEKATAAWLRPQHGVLQRGFSSPAKVGVDLAEGVYAMHGEKRAVVSFNSRQRRWVQA